MSPDDLEKVYMVQMESSSKLTYALVNQGAFMKLIQSQQGNLIKDAYLFAVKDSGQKKSESDRVVSEAGQGCQRI